MDKLINKITAPNGGIFTGQGTNTYLIGKEDVTLIDPGPNISAHIEAILEDKIVFKPQDDTKASYAIKISKSETRINWSDSAKNIIGKINGLYPNSYFIYNGERYKLLKVELSTKTGEPGSVLSDNLEIACKDGSIKVLEIQKEGKRQQKINEFMRGSQIKKGSNFNNA